MVKSVGCTALVASAQIVLAFVAGSAFAADRDLHLPLKAATAAEPATIWTGFYIGAHAGYALANNTYTLDPLIAGAAGFDSTNIFGSRGSSFGALAGFNVLVTPRWLVGIEADWSAQDIKTEMSSSFVGVDITAKQDWAFSLRGRVGYLATPGTLVYGTAGWAWSRVELTTNTIGNIPPEVTTSDQISGLQIGAGVETALAGNLRARLEYLQTFYSAAAVTQPTFPLVDEIKPSVGLARVAVIYQFGGGPQWGAAAWSQQPVPALWTGFYAGASFGGAVGYSNLSIPTAPVEIDGFGLAGPLPSAFVGINYLFAPRWLIGAEAEVAPSIRSTDLKLGAMEAVRGRFGYLLMPNTLLYGTVGWIGTDFDDLSTNGFVLVHGQHLDGWQLGGGFEVAVDAQWHLRFDYQYAILRQFDLMLPINPGPVAATAEPRGHAGRIALVRQFGGP